MNEERHCPECGTVLEPTELIATNPPAGGPDRTSGFMCAKCTRAWFEHQDGTLAVAPGYPSDLPD